MNFEAGHVYWSRRGSRAIHARMPNSNRTLCNLDIKRWQETDQPFTCTKCNAFAFPMASITPSPNYLSYMPKEGQYCLGTVWGYSYNSIVRCVFYIMNCTTGEEIETTPKKSRDAAIAMRPKLVRQVQRMNKEDKLAT